MSVEPQKLGSRLCASSCASALSPPPPQPGRQGWPDAGGAHGPFWTSGAWWHEAFPKVRGHLTQGAAQVCLGSGTETWNGLQAVARSPVRFRPRAASVRYWSIFSSLVAPAGPPLSVCLRGRRSPRHHSIPRSLHQPGRSQEWGTLSRRLTWGTGIPGASQGLA